MISRAAILRISVVPVLLAYIGLSGCDAGTSSETATGGATQAGGSAAAGTGAAGGTAASTASPLVVSVSGQDPYAVSPHFFGQNYWSWVKAWGNPVGAVSSAVLELKLGLLRAGGANNQTATPEPFSLGEIDDFMAFARAAGSAPLLQVSVIKGQEGAPASAADAAAVVRYVNQTKNYGVRYFSIGNEPDLYGDQGLVSAGYDAKAACTTFAEYAQAMRAVDPSIEIMGPDLSWKYEGANDWLTPFLESCGGEVDVVAVHRYPFAPTGCTEAAAFADAGAFRATIRNLRATMAKTGQANKPLAITEANITYDGEPEKSTLPASPGTFAAGLWLADSLGVALEEQLHSISYWSLSEGWTLGFFDGTQPRPAAHVLKLFATLFGSQVLHVTGTSAEVSVYAGRDPATGTTSLFVVNKSATARELRIAFTELPRSQPVTSTVTARSLTVMGLPDAGGPARITTYQDGTSGPI